jgi:hypothetical protein
MGPVNLVKFDPINRMILLTVIPLSGAHCTSFGVMSFHSFDDQSFGDMSFNDLSFDKPSNSHN